MKKLLLIVLLFSLGIVNGFAQSGEMKQSIGLIVSNLNASKQSIKKYGWIETTTVFYNGQQKTVIQKQCYYDVTGVLMKVATGGGTQAKQPGGLRGAIAKNKKEDIESYIEKAVEKIKQYTPPQGEKIQQIYAAGNASVNILEPGKKMKFTFPNYLQNGDSVVITLDLANKLLLDYSVNTFVTDATDLVNFDVLFSTLPDGTEYPGTITFNSASQKLKIVIQNSGYTNAK